MSELWIWSVQTTSAPDVTGWDVVAMDGEIGKIDEASYDADAGGSSSTPAGGSSGTSA